MRGAVLLHGMGRTRRMMARMERVLSSRGYVVANVGYRSLGLPLESHAATVRHVVSDLVARGCTEVHFVCHSLGGLVTRAALAEPFPGSRTVTRVVTMGTPHSGSSFADALAARVPNAWRLAMGPCTACVTTAGIAGVPVPADGGAEWGVIAGGNGAGGFNPLLRGDNDFVVTVRETGLPGCKDSTRIRGLHSFLPSTAAGISQTLAFLQRGEFDR